MKICTKCGEERDLCNYYKDKRTKDGLYSSCKLCHNKTNKSNLLFNVHSHPNPSNVAGLFIKRILVRVTYNQRYINTRCLFSRKELENYLIKNWEIYMELWRSWKENGWLMGDAPSIDRVNSKGDYSLNNIEIVPHKENCGRANRGNLWSDERKEAQVKNYSDNPHKCQKKLTLGQIKEILKRHEEGETQTSLAEEFGINSSLISNAKAGRIYKKLLKN